MYFLHIINYNKKVSDVMKFYPEGSSHWLQRSFDSTDEIKEAMIDKTIIESKALLCDREHNLHIDLGVIRGIIPRDEGALGIEEGKVRDIALISRVNKPVCFFVIGFEKDIYGCMCALLSRRAVQKKCIDEYISHLNTGDIIDARVTHLEKFGAFIDIGAGINALIPIDMLSVSRISHPRERLSEGQDIKVVLRKKEPEKLTFSLKELLGTWEENAQLFSVGETVTGVIKSIEDYGIFVELTPNLAGLAELCENVKVGDIVAVYIKSIIPQKMKIKLIIVEGFATQSQADELKYFINDGHIDIWQYSPSSSIKQISTSFFAENDNKNNNS